MLKIVRGDSYLPDIEGLGKYFQVENWMYVNPLQDANLNRLSPNEQEVLDACIDKYSSLSYDEIKEKSHDIAWRSTARDFAIQWDNIAREAGLDEVEVACLQDYSTMHPLPERDLTPDELYDAIEKEIDYIYAQK